MSRKEICALWVQMASERFKAGDLVGYTQARLNAYATSTYRGPLVTYRMEADRG